MSIASELRQRAERYLRMIWQFTDAGVVKALTEVAGKLEVRADEAERENDVRIRAHQIWVEHGRPAGRDVEFWLAAEQEVANRRTRR